MKNPILPAVYSPLLSNDQVKFQEDLLYISRTTLSSKLLTHHKDHFAKLAVEAVLRLKSSGNLEAIHVIKKLGGSLIDSYLDEGETTGRLMHVLPLTEHGSWSQLGHIH